MGKKPSNAIFVDTSFIIGLINEQDDHHIEAQNLAKQYQNYHTITTDAILLVLHFINKSDYSKPDRS